MLGSGRDARQDRPATRTGTVITIPAADRARWIAGVSLAALVIYLALTPLPPFAANPFSTHLRRYVIMAVLLLGWSVALRIRNRLPRATPYDPALLLIALALLLAVTRAMNPRLAIEPLLPLLPVAVLLVALHDLEAYTPAVLARALLAAAAVVSVFVLAAVWRSLDDWYSLVRAVEGGVSWDTLLPPKAPRVGDVGNHPNILGCLFAVSLPGVALLWPEGRRVERALLALACVLILPALFFTLSRAAWLGAAVGVGVAVAGMLLGQRHLRLSRRALVTLGVAGAVVVLGGLALWSSDARPDWLFRDSLGPRSDLRRAGWEIFRDNPLTGVGPGQFVSLYPLYSGAYPFAAVHTHNIVVQTAVDTGLFGLAAGAVLVACVIRTAVTRWRVSGRGGLRAVAAGLGMLCAFAVHALADAPQLFPETLTAGVVGLVILARAPDAGHSRFAGLREPRSRRRLLLKVTPIVVVLAAVALPGGFVLTTRGHGDYQRGLRAAGEERWPDAIRLMRRAVVSDPRQAAYWYGLGAAHAGAAVEGDRQAEQEAARFAFQRGLELDAHNGAALVNWMALNVALERPEEAETSLPALGRLAGRDSLLLLAHATMTQWVSPPEQAVESYAGLLVLNPTLLATPFWESDPFRSANLDRIVDRALARVPEVAGEGPAATSLRNAIELYSGRRSPTRAELEAELAARPNDPNLQVAVARLLLGLPDGWVRADTLLRSALRRQGDNAAAHAALGDLRLLVEDTEGARREWMRASALGNLGATIALGRSYGEAGPPERVLRQAEAQVLSMELERFYLIFQTFRFRYQRGEPVPIILPGDWLNALPREYGEYRAQVEAWRTASND